MKLRKFTPLPKKLVKRKKHGFALIASLTLMMLLALLAVGIMSTAATQSRISAQTILQAQARQQALVGLDAALGELQLALGPDCRVTANSGITEKAGSQYILGVWDSWTGPIYGTAKHGERKGSTIKETYKKGRESMFRQWLVSSANPAELKKFANVAVLGTSRPGKRVCMVGEGTLGTAASRDENCVFADLVYTPAIGRNRPCYAWWVGGENQKSKVTIQDPQIGTNPQEVLRATWNTPAPIFRDGSFNAGDIEEPEKLLTMRSLAHVDGVTQFGMPYFFDVTTSSYSLPVNVRSGGLKQDLCLLLGKQGVFEGEREFRGDDTRDCPLVEYDSDLRAGTEKNMPIGSWQTLYAYYNSWPDGSAKDSDNFTARLLGDAANAYTRMSGAAYASGGSTKPDGSSPDSVQPGQGSIYDSRSMMDSGSKHAGYARTPVMLAQISTFGLVTEEQSKGLMTNDKENKEKMYTLSVCFAPMVLWWNPYNVPMRVRGRQLWSQSLPYKSAWIQTYGFPLTRTPSSWEDKIWGIRGVSQSDFGADYGEFFQSSENDPTGDIVFQPGEIIFFSPANARQNKQAMYSNPWVAGYNPSAVAGYSAKVYHHDVTAPSSQIGVACESNIDAGHFYVNMRLGLRDVDVPQNSKPDGYHFAPQRFEAITLYNGYNGMGQGSGASGSIGKFGQGPQRGLLGWYDPDDTSSNTVFCDRDRNDSTWSRDGSQSDSAVPYFIAAMGIVPKSANLNLDSRMLAGEDFRTKSWQHSSPAFWGSMIINPDNQQRQYHPYQLAALDVGAGMNACPMDNVGRNGMLGINAGGEQVSFVSVLELPVHPPFSIAGFSGMRLQPGWYASGGTSSIASLRRMQYQNGVPGVGIGNAFADPCLPSDGVYASHKTNIPNVDGGNGQVFNDFFDHGLLINDAMWDRWFCSSISDMPDKKAKDVATEFFSAKKEGKGASRNHLPVARYVRTGEPYSDQDIVKRIMDKEGWKHIAQYLMVDGGFNVNSTSVDAWAAALQGLARRQLVTNASGKLALVEGSSEDNTDTVLFPRFSVSTSNKSIDPNGGYNMMMGASDLRGGGSGLAAWGDIRELDASQIRQLAECIVEQVRERGPFLNMSDFVNRRLDKSNPELSLKGALQAAIDNASLNDGFDDETTNPQTDGDLYKFPEAEEGSIYTAAPGYLIQSDILLSLGNILTVRDDTFTVRAYGCVRNDQGGVLAQAWCEAIVQRTIEYVDSKNDPADSDYEPDGSSSRTKLTSTNKTLGRKFRIVSFKWLDAWDI